MMLSNFYLSEPFKWDTINVNTLIIENPKLYYSIVNEMVLQTQGEKGNFILSDELHPTVNFYKNVEIITDVFKIDFTDKKIINGVYKDLAEGVRCDLYDKSCEIYSYINKSILDMISDYEFDLRFDDLNDMLPLFKGVNLSIDDSELKLGEKIILYMELLNKFMQRKLFVILNLKICMSQNEYQLFLKDVIYRKINLLLIESHETYRDDNEKIKIIDKDMCEI